MSTLGFPGGWGGGGGCIGGWRHISDPLRRVRFSLLRLFMVTMNNGTKLFLTQLKARYSFHTVLFKTNIISLIYSRLKSISSYWNSLHLTSNATQEALIVIIGCSLRFYKSSSVIRDFHVTCRLVTWCFWNINAMYHIILIKRVRRHRSTDRVDMRRIRVQSNLCADEYL